MYTPKFSTVAVLCLLAFVMTNTICQAQEWGRKGKKEIYGIFQTMGGGEATGSGMTFDFDDTNVYGFGIGYNIDNHWNINTDFLFGSTDIDITGAVATAGDSDLFLWDVNLDYNLLEDRLTPFVTIGIGIFSNSGDLNNGLSFSETNFSWNWGAGGRWDITDKIFLKAMYRFIYHDMEDLDGPDYDGVMISLGCMF